jgi:hypothetical protein
MDHKDQADQKDPKFQILNTGDGKIFYYFTSYPEKDEHFHNKYNKIYCVQISGFLRNHDGKLCWSKQSAFEREYTYWRCYQKNDLEILNNYTTAPFVNKYVSTEMLFELAKKSTSIGDEGRIYVATQ